MRIFYIDIAEFKTRYDKDFLETYADRDFKTEKKFYEYTIGRYLVKNISKKIYNITNPEIVINSQGKPVFAGNEINFNLSHSNNYIIACFDENLCGIDIEYIKERDLNKLSEYYKNDFKNNDDFYKYWTLKESTYKLQSTVNDKYTQKFKNKYYITVTSTGKIQLPLNIENALDFLDN